MHKQTTIAKELKILKQALKDDPSLKNQPEWKTRYAEVCKNLKIVSEGKKTKKQKGVELLAKGANLIKNRGKRTKFGISKMKKTQASIQAELKDIERQERAMQQMIKSGQVTVKNIKMDVEGLRKIGNTLADQVDLAKTEETGDEIIDKTWHKMAEAFVDKNSSISKEVALNHIEDAIINIRYHDVIDEMLDSGIQVKTKEGTTKNITRDTLQQLIEGLKTKLREHSKSDQKETLTNFLDNLSQAIHDQNPDIPKDVAKEYLIKFMGQ